MAAERLPVQKACRLLGVSESGYYAWKTRVPSNRQIRHAWLLEQIQAVHEAARGVYGARRVWAELTMGLGLQVGRSQVELVMSRAGLRGIPGPRRSRQPRSNAPLPGDLVRRKFGRDHPNMLWVTDVTEHRTREGKIYCAVVLDTFSRKVVGWAIDSSPDAALVTNALHMAIETRKPQQGTVIHSDHGTVFRSWVFTQRVQAAGLLPSMGAIGSCYDNSMIESFWGRMQTELLDRQSWRTRLELANAIFEYLEMFHNRKRRHSRLGMRSPVEYEKLYEQAKMLRSGT